MFTRSTKPAAQRGLPLLGAPRGQQVNDGRPSVTITGRYRQTQHAEWDVNCSHCTAAAILKAATGTHWTASQVGASMRARVLKAEGLAQWRGRQAGLDPLPGRSAYDSESGHLEKLIDDQVEGFTHFVRKHLGFCRFSVFGEKGNPAPLGDALEWMRALSGDPLFGVLIANEGHWVFARQRERGVDFTDYQTDRVFTPGSAPTTGDLPMLGISNKVFPDARLIVIAFWPFQTGEFVPPAACNNRSAALPAVQAPRRPTVFLTSGLE